VAASVISFFEEAHNQDVLKSLRASGLWPEPIEKEETFVDHPLTGKVIVLTGTFSQIKRSEAQTALRKLGAKPTGSVSKNTDLVIAGENAGSKLSRAEELGIKVVDETQLMEWLS